MNTLPSVSVLNQIKSVSGVERLLRRSDLAQAPIGWWNVLVAICNGGLVGADAGSVDEMEWGVALVDSLDRMLEVKVVGIEETIHRKMMAEAMLLRDFGASKNNKYLDPEMIFDRFVDDVALTRVELLGVREVLHTSEPSLALAVKAFRMVRIMEALKSLRVVVNYMPAGHRREEAVKWCNLEPLLK